MLGLLKFLSSHESITSTAEKQIVKLVLLLTTAYHTQKTPLIFKTFAWSFCYELDMCAPADAIEVPKRHCGKNAVQWFLKNIQHNKLQIHQL